jgi:GPH family glycoside/pentoside/hexuronide:cation symporter
VTNSERLPRYTKFLYGIGDTGFSLTSSILGAYFALFLTDVVGLAPGMAAIAIFLGRSWDYVNDPLIGHISDRTRTRWGRRRPFLLFGFAPFALAFSLLWWRPPWQSDVALAVYYSLAYLIYDAAATFAYMPYFALTPELTEDYDERTELTGYRMFFTVPLAIVGSFEPSNASRVFAMGVMFGAISALPLLLTFLGTYERPEHLAYEQPNLRRSLRAALKNRPFVFTMGLFLFTWAAVNVLQSTLLYFVKYWLRREGQSDLIMGVIFVTAILVLPFWTWASRRWNKRRAYIFGVAFWAAVQIVLVVLNPAAPLPLLLGMSVLAGVGVGAAHVLPWAIIPDAIEWDEWQTGKRHEGMFYSLVMLVQKMASSLTLPLALLLMEATGYVSNAPQQTESALWGIRLLVGPIPAVLLCAGILFAGLYPMDRELHHEVRQQLKLRRAQGSEEG